MNDPFSAQRGSEETWQRRSLFISNYTLRLKPQLFYHGSCKTLQTQNCHFSSSATHFLIKAQGRNHDFEPHAIQATTCVSNVITFGQHPHTTSLHPANESTELQQVLPALYPARLCANPTVLMLQLGYTLSFYFQMGQLRLREYKLYKEPGHTHRLIWSQSP